MWGLFDRLRADPENFAWLRVALVRVAHIEASGLQRTLMSCVSDSNPDRADQSIEAFSPESTLRTGERSDRFRPMQRPSSTWRAERA